MTTVEPAASISAWSWWGHRRLPYNLVLIAAGGLGWVMSSVSIWVSQPLLPVDEAGEVTLFTVIFQGMVFGIGLIAANVCFTGGPIVEHLIKPKPPKRYRQWAFGLGTAFSLMLILSFPTLSVIGAVGLLVGWLP